MAVYPILLAVLDATVAPRGGAWIETCVCVNDERAIYVAPRGGAWIVPLASPVSPFGT